MTIRFLLNCGMLCECCGLLIWVCLCCIYWVYELKWGKPRAQLIPSKMKEKKVPLRMSMFHWKTQHVNPLWVNLLWSSVGESELSRPTTSTCHCLFGSEHTGVHTSTYKYVVLNVVFTLHVKNVHGSSFLKLFLELVLPTLLTIVANWANLETKFLVPFSKIGHSYINDRECVGHRSVKFQHRPLLTRACLQAKMTKRLKQRVSVCARSQCMLVLLTWHPSYSALM